VAGGLRRRIDRYRQFVTRLHTRDGRAVVVVEIRIDGPLSE
jgi:hypothetical protein